MIFFLTKIYLWTIFISETGRVKKNKAPVEAENGEKLVLDTRWLGALHARG